MRGGMTAPVYCAIGDIHGELGRLMALHAEVRLHARAAWPGRPVQLVHLGDLVDRGPDSAGVIDCVMNFSVPGWPAPVTLRGNHEQMMIDALADPARESSEWRHWLRNGGAQTLHAYSDRPASDLIAHLDWLKSLPTLHIAERAGLVFVHGGVDPDRFPHCGEEVHMWTRRPEFFDPRFWTAPALRGRRVIHGHTPTDDFLPESAGGGRRLNIDTGAVYGGRLTAVFLEGGTPDYFLHT